jgi:hypothetical protein
MRFHKKNYIQVNWWVIYAIFLTSCSSTKSSDDDKVRSSVLHGVDIPSVYKRYLEFPEPSGTLPVRVNPPVLRWPPEKGRQVTYEVRLARDSIFSNDVLGISQTPWAMFNPHQKLELGTWYWQYRKSNGTWSDAQSFEVDGKALSIVAPAPSALWQGIPKSRPKVLATESDLLVLRDMEMNDDRKAVIDEGDNALHFLVPEENDGIPKQKVDDEEQERKFRLDASLRLGTSVYKAILSLAEAHILTGNEKYAQKAIEIAMEIAGWDPKGVSSLNDFGDARCMVAMSIVYDTFYEKLGEDQKAGLVQAIMPRASHLYQGWKNNIEGRLLSGHVWQHILHYFFQTALALYGDEQDAAEWLAYAYELFLARAPVLGGMDGGWIEGVSYFRMNMETMIDIPLHIKKYTGFDFINTHPWYLHQINWMIYHIPPGSAPDGFGDNTEEVNSPGVDYAAFALEIAKLTGNESAAWYARECALHENLNLSATNILRWIRLTKTKAMPLPTVLADPDLSMGKSFRDIGMVAMHTQPGNTSENLMVAMRSSPFGSYGHMLSDQNVFNVLFGGKKLFYRTGYKVTMKDPHRTGWYQHTKSQNGILVDGEGQPYSTEAFGWIARFMQGGDLAYAKGDASKAYQSDETGEDYGVSKNHRHIALLKPDVVVIYDELEADKKVEWSWLIHSLEEISLGPDPDTFSASLDKVKGMGRLWGSQPVILHLTDTFDVPAVNWRGSRDQHGSLKTYEDNQWHLKASTADKTSNMRFLTVLRVASGDVPSDWTASEIEDGVVDIQIGNWKIKANVEASLEPGIHIRNEERGTVFSSHGEPVEIGKKTYEGNYSGSSKLAFMEQGKLVFCETLDELPFDMQRKMGHYQKNKP